MGDKKMDVQIVFFLAGIALLVAAGFIYLKREDNDYVRLITAVTDVRTDLSEMEKKVAELAEDHEKQCAGLEGQILSLKSQSDRIEKVSKEPMKVSITRMVPIEIEYSKRGEKPPPPLLKRAGIRKYKEDGITPRENN